MDMLVSFLTMYMMYLFFIKTIRHMCIPRLCPRILVVGKETHLDIYVFCALVIKEYY